MSSPVPYALDGTEVKVIQGQLRRATPDLELIEVLMLADSGITTGFERFGTTYDGVNVTINWDVVPDLDSELNAAKIIDTHFRTIHRKVLSPDGVPPLLASFVITSQADIIGSDEFMGAATARLGAHSDEVEDLALVCTGLAKTNNATNEVYLAYWDEDTQDWVEMLTVNGGPARFLVPDHSNEWRAFSFISDTPPDLLTRQYAVFGNKVGAAQFQLRGIGVALLRVQ
jgi:hypothetical protein